MIRKPFYDYDKAFARTMHALAIVETCESRLTVSERAIAFDHFILWSNVSGWMQKKRHRVITWCDCAWMSHWRWRNREVGIRLRASSKCENEISKARKWFATCSSHSIWVPLFPPISHKSHHILCSCLHTSLWSTAVHNSALCFSLRVVYRCQ